MRTARCRPFLVKRGEVADVESQDGAVLFGREVELCFIQGSIHACLLSRQHIKTAATKIQSELLLDVSIQVKPDK